MLTYYLITGMLSRIFFGKLIYSDASNVIEIVCGEVQSVLDGVESFRSKFWLEVGERLFLNIEYVFAILFQLLPLSRENSYT